MEHHVQSVDDALVGGLSYKLKAGASYVSDRRLVTFFASGGNQYSPSGVMVCKFKLWQTNGSIHPLLGLCSQLIIQETPLPKSYTHYIGILLLCFVVLVLLQVTKLSKT